jgi:putative effector of murein hydrolase
MIFDNPLTPIVLTVAAFAAGSWLYQRSGRLAMLQPVLIAIVSMSIFLIAGRFSYEGYLERTKPLYFLLGPAIVALSVPLFENLRKAQSFLVPVMATFLLGGACVTGGALVLGLLLRLDGPMEISLTTKSVTVPIALAVAEKIGGTVSLTIFSVFTSGVLGSAITPSLLRLIGVRDPMIIGFTLGFTSHAFGIARSIEFGPEAAAFATLAMVLMGCASAVVVPVVFRLF